MVEKGNFYIKSITFNRFEESEGVSIRLKAFSAQYGAGDNIPVEMKITSKYNPVDHVDVYANNLLIGTSNVSPYTVNFVPNAKGTYSIMAIVTTEDGKQKISQSRTLEVTYDVPTAIRTIDNDAADDADAPAYNLMGVPVGDGYRGIIIRNGKKVIKK